MELLGHPGEAYGLISDWYFSKEERFGVIFMTNGAWEGYSFGDQSAFYSLEEEVFAAVAEHALGACTTETAEPGESLPLVSPNPAENELNIRNGKSLPFWKRWFIRDSSGRVILSAEGAFANFTIDVSGIPGGIYVLELHGDSKTYSVRWVKS